MVNPNTNSTLNQNLNQDFNAQNILNDPLHIASSDHPDMMLTTTSFNRSNFLGWSRTIKMALGAKLKFGFVDGTSPKPRVIDGDYQRSTDLDQRMVTAVCQEMMKMFKGQGLDPSSTKKVLAVGQGFHNLYICKPSSYAPIKVPSIHVLSSFVNKEAHLYNVTLDLFHARIGHTSVSKLIHVPECKHHNTKRLSRETCLLAKHVGI
nr:hypothetical protein [Tanacetum cinerariifolium]